MKPSRSKMKPSLHFSCGNCCLRVSHIAMLCFTIDITITTATATRRTCEGQKSAMKMKTSSINQNSPIGVSFTDIPNQRFFRVHTLLAELIFC